MLRNLFTIYCLIITSYGCAQKLDTLNLKKLTFEGRVIVLGKEITDSKFSGFFEYDSLENFSEGGYYMFYNGEILGTYLSYKEYSNEYLLSEVEFSSGDFYMKSPKLKISDSTDIHSFSEVYPRSYDYYIRDKNGAIYNNSTGKDVLQKYYITLLTSEPKGSLNLEFDVNGKIKTASFSYD